MQKQQRLRTAKHKLARLEQALLADDSDDDSRGADDRA
jgi:hypothetical protein